MAGLDVGRDDAAGLLVTALPGLLVWATSGLAEVGRGFAGALVRLLSLGSFGFPAGLLVVVLVKASVDGGFGDFLTAPTAAAVT